MAEHDGSYRRQRLCGLHARDAHFRHGHLVANRNFRQGRHIMFRRALPQLRPNWRVSLVAVTIVGTLFMAKVDAPASVSATSAALSSVPVVDPGGSILSHRKAKITGALG